MTFYQIMNFQHQPVRVFKTQDEAQRYIKALQESAYANEGFYIIALAVVYQSGEIE